MKIMRWDNREWDEKRWGDKRWVETKWDEKRLYEMRSDKVRKKFNVRLSLASSWAPGSLAVKLETCSTVWNLSFDVCFVTIANIVKIGLFHIFQGYSLWFLSAKKVESRVGRRQSVKRQPPSRWVFWAYQNDDRSTEVVCCEVRTVRFSRAKDV